MDSRVYWRAMWGMLAAAPAFALLGALVHGNGFGTPLFWLAGICAFGGILALRMWMWQKAYEGKPQA